MVRTKAAISAGVSPFARRATAKPAICAGVASPSRIVDRARPASSAVSSSPRMSLVSRTGQKGVSASGDIACREYRWGVRQGGSGGAASLAEHPAALPFGEPAPDSVLLAGGEGELQAGFAHGAHPADGLRLFGQAVVFRRGIEHQGVAPLAEAGGPPVLWHRSAHLLLPATPLQDRTTHVRISPRWHQRK